MLGWNQDDPKGFLPFGGFFLGPNFQGAYLLAVSLGRGRVVHGCIKCQVSEFTDKRKGNEISVPREVILY